MLQNMHQHFKMDVSLHFVHPRKHQVKAGLGFWGKDQKCKLQIRFLLLKGLDGPFLEVWLTATHFSLSGVGFVPCMHVYQACCGYGTSKILRQGYNGIQTSLLQMHTMVSQSFYAILLASVVPLNHRGSFYNAFVLVFFMTLKPESGSCSCQVQFCYS